MRREPALNLLSRLLGVVLVVCGLVACGDDFRDFDTSVPHDAGVPSEDLGAEGGVPVHALFTVSGCDRLEFDADDRPRCTASKERPLTFVPLGVGVSTFVWTFPNATPASSTLVTPEAHWSRIGTYTVSLAAGGGGGTALGTGTVQIVAGGVGTACLNDTDCDAATGLTCLCGAGAGCPASLAAGLCARRCETSPCAPGEACIDLARGGVAVPDGGTTDGGAADAFRARVCLPSCANDASCRTGFSCRQLPQVSASAPLGAAYTWTHACFAPVLGDVGASCASPDGTPDRSQCLTGHCEGIGARGVCTDVCDADSPCPTNAVCATLPSIGARCLRRCVAGEDCGDPLVSCGGAGAGGLGFSLPPAEPGTSLLCAPKRCTTPSDCSPAGSCTTVSGAKFCLK